MDMMEHAVADEASAAKARNATKAKQEVLMIS